MPNAPHNVCAERSLPELLRLRVVNVTMPALSQDQLHIAQAEAEHVVQPDGMADDLGGEPMAIVGVGWRLHAASLIRLQANHQIQLP